MTDKEFEQVIIKTIYANPMVSSKIVPQLDDGWFFDPDHKAIARAIISHNAEWGALPNVIEIKRKLTDQRNIAEFDACMAIPDENVRTDFILGEIEEFVRRRLVKNVTDMALEYCRVGDKKVSIADEMADAEAFNFDDHIGVDILDDPEFLYEGIVANEKIFTTGVKAIDEMLGGGVHENSLNLILSPTNVGKTLCMCSIACSLALAGKKVLYVTFEDPELKINQRVMQNLMDVTQAQLKTLQKDAYIRMHNKVKQKCGSGKLKVIHYPEFSTNAMMINSLLKDLKERQQFEPDVLIIDYIGCMIPNGRVNKDMNDNTRLLLVSMQVRALATTYHFPIISAAQVNRGGYGSAEIGLDDVADSFGQTTKADAILAITCPPECVKAGLYKVFLAKTRYGITGPTATTIGVDREKQRIYDLTAGQKEDYDDSQEPDYYAGNDDGPDVNDFK